MLRRRFLSAGLIFGALLAGQTAARAVQPYGPPPIPSVEPKAVAQKAGGQGSEAEPKPAYNYGVGYAVPWLPASGKHWRRDARLEYYSNPPSPTWRWFHTGRGCTYDRGLHYGIGYPFTCGYQYPKYTRDESLPKSR